jgi:hypothetical protein
MHLAIAFGQTAVEKGYKVCFERVTNLIKLLKTAEVQKTSEYRIRRIMKSELVIIDGSSTFQVGSLIASEPSTLVKEVPMLQELFPRVHGRYSSLPVLGPTTEGFAAFLVGRGYPRRLVRFHLRAARRVDERLRRRRCRSITEVTRADLLGCAPAAGRSQEDIGRSAVVRLLEVYLTEQGMLRRPELSNAAEQRLGEYGRYLEKVRGLARSTIEAHLATASHSLPISIP